MGQPYGKTNLPSDWQRNFLHSITSFNRKQLKISTGIRIGIFIIALLAIGLVSNHIRESVIAILGTINVSLLDVQRPKWTIMVRTLILVSIINASLFTIGSLIGTTNEGYLGVALFAIGLFIISYMGVYPNASASIVIISSVIFSVGVSLPGLNVIPAYERFLLLLLGGLWGTLGAAAVIIPIINLKKKSRPAIIEKGEKGKGKTKSSSIQQPQKQPHSSSLFSFLHSRISLQLFKPLISNISPRAGHFQFSLAFAVTGAIGLLIAQSFGIMRGYWVLITLCVLLLRSDIAVTFSFTSMRIIGTIIGAVVGMIIIANVIHSIWLLSFMLFALASTYFALRNVNYALGTLFLTSFVLVLLDILVPGQTIFAQIRILDTLIGAGLALLGVFIMWILSYSKK